uniref:(northern house mosquito) hypothetical protein n=1 Tax=Culex pipiens TaxID=7175 RepID=A0A8D8NSS8_CULPI
MQQAFPAINQPRSAQSNYQRGRPETLPRQVRLLEAKSPQELPKRQAGHGLGQELRHDPPEAFEHDESVQQSFRGLTTPVEEEKAKALTVELGGGEVFGGRQDEPGGGTAQRVVWHPVPDQSGEGWLAGDWGGCVGGCGREESAEGTVN